MTNQPTISVAIPFFNAERYLEKCIESLLAQTFTDFEVVFISDHSTDGSEALIKQKTADDRRFRLIQCAGKGISDGRNTGIQAAKGEYLYYLDADDWVEPNCLQLLLTQLEETNSDVCLLNFDVVNDVNQPVPSKIKIPHFPKSTVTSAEALKLLFSDQLRHYPWSMLMKRQLLLANQIEFPTGRRYEDYATTFKIFAVAKQVAFVDQPLYHYVQHQGSITHRVDFKDAQDIMAITTMIDQYSLAKLADLLPQVVQYELPRLYIAYTIAVKAHQDVPNFDCDIQSAIIKKVRQHHLFQLMTQRDRFKYFLLKTGLLKQIYRLK
jgi:glycosyltransferase involved in cell wall biosynthesis